MERVVPCRPHAALLLLFGLACGGLACERTGSSADRSGRPSPAPSPATPSSRAAPAIDAGPPPTAPTPTTEPPGDAYPLSGLVTGLQIPIRQRPDPESTSIGTLRIGSRVRLKDNRHPAKNCATGFYPVEPRGWACAGQGIALDAAAVRSGFAVTAPDRALALPYAYYFVTQLMTAEYHRPPSDQEQRATWAFARRFLDLEAEDPERAARFRAGELPDEPSPPAVVRRFMDRGFYVAVPRGEDDPQAEFIRTVRGGYVWRARLKAREGSSFQGVELTAERSLPVAWMRRSARPRQRRMRSDGTPRWAENHALPVRERQTVVEDWLRRERLGEHLMHVLSGDQYYLAWFISVAEPIDPRLVERLGIAEDEVFVHVDVSEQTLVVYRGRTPLFATLVSTGVEGHDTPTGYFRVQRKMVSDTMANLGPDAGDEAYRIEDVPWTQYFEGNVALHGAFWHDGFGLPRSHGCVNLSPRDAHRVFELTEPSLPTGWHGVEASRDRPGSRVLITP